MPQISARKTDPVTSHQAAEHMQVTGTASSQRFATLTALKSYPNTTSAELAQAAELDRYMVARRLPELRDSGRVVMGKPRRCTVGKRNAVTWSPK